MKTSKKKEILDCAQELIQKRGYNGFSYADISQLIGIRKASIHHYFPTKVDLGIAVIERYRALFNLRLEEIELDVCWETRISGYAALYQQVLRENKLCLCGMLASDHATLTEELHAAIQAFFADNAIWLTKILTQEYPAIESSILTSHAWGIINSLQGAVMVSRIMTDVTIFDTNYNALMQQLRHIR